MLNYQINKILNNYPIIILVLEQKGKIISAQDKLISQSGAEVAEYTRLVIITLKYDVIEVNAERHLIELFSMLDRWKKLVRWNFAQ